MRRTLFDTGGALVLAALVAFSGVAHVQHMLCPSHVVSNSAEAAPDAMAHHGHSEHQADDTGDAPGTDGSCCDSCELCQAAPIATELGVPQVMAATGAPRAARHEPTVPATSRAWNHPPLLPIPPPIAAAV